MLELRGITKTYESHGVQTPVLKGIDLVIQRGAFAALLGQSGSGKSTLLNILGLIDAPTSGQYIFMGTPTDKLSEAARSNLRNKSIGYIFQAFHLIGELNVLDNVTLAMGYAGISAKARRERGLFLLDQVGLSHRANYWPSQLSGGEKQRVAIARAIANHPFLILADEPTGNLDSRSAAEVMKHLHQLHEQGTTIVMVTHNTELARECSSVYTLEDGKIL